MLQKKIFFAIVAVAFLSFVLNLAKGEHVIISQRCMESATRCGMELTRSVAWNQDAGKGMHGYAVMIYSSKGADEMHAKA